MKSHSLKFSLSVAEVKKEAQHYKVEAREEECQVLAKRFSLPKVKSLKAFVKVWDGGKKEGIYVAGELVSDVTQSCGVSLEEIDETVKTDFELLLVDPETADRLDADEAYLNPDLPEYDALEGDEIPIGEIIAQTLSMSLNPYPRSENTEVTISKSSKISLNEAELEKPNPFAVLQKLRDES